MKILVIIPAYNEEKSILTTVQTLRNIHPEVDAIVVNDASKDKTKKILSENHIHYIDLPVNLGIGGGVQTGYMYAYRKGYDVAIQMDGDGQHPASELDKIIAPIKDGRADIVVGSRFVNKEGFQSSAIRRFGIKFLSSLIYLCTGKHILDVTSGYRAVNRKYIKIFSEEYAQDYPEPEALVTAAKKGAEIVEVPVMMKERQGGISSISPIKSIYYMVKVSLAIIIKKISE